MIQKESYGSNTFAAVRVGEIQEGTNTKDWYWTASEFNIADLLTRGSKPNDIDISSKWQKGPHFLQLHESEWPITKIYSEQKTPINTIKLELSSPAIQTNPKDTLASRINIEKYSVQKIATSYSPNFGHVQERTKANVEKCNTTANSR